MSQADKLPLVVLDTKLRSTTNRTTRQLRDVIRIFQPETVFKWHPGVGSAQMDLWGNGRIEGECRKLGDDISDETVGNILARYGIPPAPERSKQGTSWRNFVNHYKDQILACDFFTVETAWTRPSTSCFSSS